MEHRPLTQGVGVEVLARIQAAGGQVVVVDGKLRLQAPAPLPSGLIAEARAHKADLLALLHSPKPDALPAYELPEPVPDCAFFGATIDRVPQPMKRPPSWAAPGEPPMPSASCSCCGTGRWWCERDAPRGWRCWMCHPPDGLMADAIQEVRT